MTEFCAGCHSVKSCAKRRVASESPISYLAGAAGAAPSGAQADAVAMATRHVTKERAIRLTFGE
jgi:hypothetical protein